MYVVTFYSFKGGVGRSLALVNVGCALAAAGRRVLLVDFDLEAPGIETFPVLQPDQPSAGVVEFVTEYVSTGATPDVREYVYKAELPSPATGALWVMPAGRRDDDYGSRLNAIDWQRLYAEQDGYLMFEDLKAQWKETYKPDYVLIDSRTGHTDVGGICTRQLPDAVAILFFPNDQNLLGLQKVVSDIRRQPRPAGARPIELHFVTSNVPDLDDEDRILVERMRRFRATLDYRRLAATIHHYDSLALLNQSVFALERPRSRLAAEYAELQKRITAGNPRDREGALLFLKETERRAESADPSRRADESRRFRDIKELHESDGEVLFALGRALESRGQFSEALDAFGDAEKKGLRSAQMFLRRAQLLRILGEDEHSPALLEAASKALQCEDASFEDTAFAVRVLRRGDAPQIETVVEAPAIGRLRDTERYRLINELLFEGTRRPLATLVDQLISAAPKQLSTLPDDQRHQLSLALIALGRFQEATEALAVAPARLAQASTPDVFNAAMAEWGACGKPDAGLLEELIRRDSSGDPELPSLKANPNYEQCLALVYALMGREQESRARASHARSLAEGMAGRKTIEIFSCWRFLTVGRPEFIADTDAIARLGEGGADAPTWRAGR